VQVTLLHEMQKARRQEGSRHPVHRRRHGIAMCVARLNKRQPGALIDEKISSQLHTTELKRTPGLAGRFALNVSQN
jgi:hypothetical protein